MPRDAAALAPKMCCNAFHTFYFAFNYIERDSPTRFYFEDYNREDEPKYYLRFCPFCGKPVGGE